jgi:hypothetical protein
MNPLSRSLLFWLSLVPLLFLLWGWRHSTQVVHSVGWVAPGKGYFVESGGSYLEFRAAPFELTKSFVRSQFVSFDEEAAPAPLFSYPDFLNNESGKSIRIPYWVIAGSYLVIGVIILRWRQRRRNRPEPN